MATVLICDNEETLRSLVRASLAQGGYYLVEAKDGDESLELARRLGPDLILLDMMMPGRSGLEVLRAVRADPELAGTRVLMLTARTQAEDRQAMLEAGADEFLAKPFSPAELARVVASLVNGG